MKNDSLDRDTLVFDNEDFSLIESELDHYEKMDTIRIDVNQGLEEALSEMDSLKKQLSTNEGDTLIECCKSSIMDTITGQFGLASMFIDCKDGGNVTTTHNFEKGITANDVDKAKFDDFKSNHDGSRQWSDVRKKTGYDDPLPGKRKQAFQTQNEIIDAYTGRPLPKDGRAHLDHIVSAKEIESNAAANLHMSPEDRAKMATKDSNLAFTDGSANQSKGDQKMKEWLDSSDKKTEGTKAERFGIDKDAALQKDKKARKEIKKEINKEAFKKYSKELLVTGGKDAAKIAAYSAIGVVLREFVQALFLAVKETFSNRGNESLKDVFIRFKTRMSEVVENLKKKWKDIFTDSIEGGLTAFFSNLLVFAVNLFATTLKKIVHMIRAGFVSLVQAVKIMVNPPAGMTQDEANYQAVKIMVAGLIGAASLGLSAAVEKFLQSIPGLQPIMMFPLPFIDQTVSDALAVTLTGIMGGLLTTIVIYAMDKFRNEGKKSKIQIQLIYQSGVVVEYKTVQSWFVLKDAYEFLQESVEQTVETLVVTRNIIIESENQVAEARAGLESAMDKLRKRNN
ncbi:hypothetical protein WCX18_07370 [Sulfurimonas sp. HSL1-2]|uniref:hypothetical protein n=1 Tax=Thiomicrolovo zhangzhouensis TaxID=3131933 RepID=UPI0031F85A41